MQYTDITNKHIHGSHDPANCEISSRAIFIGIIDLDVFNVKMRG